MKDNQKIRRAARVADVPLWKIAAQIGVSEPTIYRWMRLPLPEDKEQMILKAIRELEAAQ